MTVISLMACTVRSSWPPVQFQFMGLRTGPVDNSYTGECPPGLVLGHALMPEPALTRGVELLAELSY